VSSEEEKRMAQRRELAKAYDPAPVEEPRFQRWVDEGRFVADSASTREASFSIVIPPPNVTGSLHMGHALDNTLQDIVCRYHRMRGAEVLWLPGTDHAGIATQNVVERSLASQGIQRRELGREAFVEKVWEWKKTYGDRIVAQLQRLGASCDWSRERFTMDEGLSRAVRAVFVRLYRKGLIYRGKYLINWCPRCRTALSDLEVDHKDQKAKLYRVVYPFADGKGEGRVEVMTTRPETILGDVAIAVHPRDERNRPLIGRTVRVPLIGRVIPVIEDNMVDPEFGTGCVKITPAHDPNDFLVGQRHGLEAIQVIDDEGKMSPEAGSYAGLDRFEARERMAADMEAEGTLIGTVEHDHSVGTCYRCSTVVEPYLSEQWFVRAKPLADAGVEAVKAGKIRFVPDQWAGVYFQWMENIRDWCISRQLWWGHRIPAWYCEQGHVTVSETDPEVCEVCGSRHLHQDEDVLDTWFSSALWPFSTMGWPEGTKDLARFYPTSLLVTGFDIIFFWVARMIMMGIEFMDEVPFRDVYIHALVRDEKGQKMSKSKGNVIDPLDIIDKYGADALRLTMAALTVQGRDIFLSESRIETYRFFLNKLWNACRFALINLEGDPETEPRLPDPAELRPYEGWILSRLQETKAEMGRLLEGYFFGEAARLMYDFVWSEVCDWYLEMAKPALRGDEGENRRRIARSVLKTLFRDVLRLLNPFIPFVTEELWGAFGFGGEVDRSGWPGPDETLRNPAAEENTLFVQELVRAVRNLRAEAHLTPQTTLPELFLRPSDPSAVETGRESEDLIRMLTRAESIRFLGVGDPRPPKSLGSVLPRGEVYLPVGALLDLDAEVRRLRGEIEKTRRDIDKSRAKLEKADFVARAPEEVVEKERAAAAAGEAKIARLEDHVRHLAG
jgi:valyl-tRNA synthetase